MSVLRRNFPLMSPEPLPGGGTPPPTTPPPTSPPPSGFTYGESHKDYVATKGWKGVDDVITSNKNLETLLGADKAGRAFIWPKDDADAEGQKALRAKLGVPEKPEDYALPLFSGQTEPDAFHQSIAAELHKHGIPKSAAQGLVKWINEQDKQLLDSANAAAEQKSTADLAALKTEWGTAHDANHGQAVTLMSHMGFTQEDIAAMSKDAGLLRKFHKGGAALGMKPAVPGDGGGAGTTQAQALERLGAAREKRAKGEMSQTEWFELMERLGPIAGASQQRAA